MPSDQSGVLLTLAYRGDCYHGWAPQPNAPTVADTVHAAIRTIDPQASMIRGASRTDAGVHARGQKAAFDTHRDLPTKAWLHLLQRQLPATIGVSRVAQVPAGYTPRFEALQKRYVYRVGIASVRDPFLSPFQWQLKKPLDPHQMTIATKRLLGSHDFRAFRSARDERQHTVRTLSRVEVVPLSARPERWAVLVEGDGFLYNMVRIIVGTLVDIGHGRMAPEVIDAAFGSGKREDLGQTAPPQGLCLEGMLLKGEPAEGAPEGRPQWPLGDIEY